MKQKATRRGVLQSRTVKPATVNRELACLKMFNYLASEYRQLRNPVSEVKCKVSRRRQLARTSVVFTMKNDYYLSACIQLLRDVATLMLETGMRPEEVYRMPTAKLCIVFLVNYV